MSFNIKTPFVVATHIKKFTATSSIKNKSKAAGLGMVGGQLFFHNGTAVKALGSNTPVAYSAGTSLTLTQALHANRIVYVTDVASAYILPAATGTGDTYTIILGATQTGAGTIKTAAVGDTMIGNAILFQDGGATVNGFSAAGTEGSIDLLGTANSTGGMIGAVYEFVDIASAKWHVSIVSDAGGTEATPFGAY
jgi:hypothetical protein